MRCIEPSIINLKFPSRWWYSSSRRAKAGNESIDWQQQLNLLTLKHTKKITIQTHFLQRRIGNEVYLRVNDQIDDINSLMVTFFFIGKTSWWCWWSWFWWTLGVRRRGDEEKSLSLFVSKRERLLSSAFQKNIALYGTQCKSLLGQRQKRAGIVGRRATSKDTKADCNLQTILHFWLSPSPHRFESKLRNKMRYTFLKIDFFNAVISKSFYPNCPNCH